VSHTSRQITFSTNIQLSSTLYQAHPKVIHIGKPTVRYFPQTAESIDRRVVVRLRYHCLFRYDIDTINVKYRDIDV